MSIAAQDLADAFGEAETALGTAMSRMTDLLAKGIAAERALGVSATVSSPAHSRAVAALSRLAEARAELVKSHKSADGIAKARGVIVQAGAGGTKTGPDDVPENPLDWFGAAASPSETAAH